MADTVPPGRPGNLTPDQEAKLQELWTRTLKIFGVAGSSADIVDGHSTENASLLSPGDQTDTNDSEKKKKKSHNPFSRKHREDAQGGSEADGKRTVRSSMDSEDKFGQTKEYNQAIATTSPEQLRQAFWTMVKHDNPDGLLLRFLRARKWDVEKALIMLISTMHWRAEEMHVDDDVIHKGEGGAALDSLNADPAIKKEGKDFMAQIRMGKSFLHGKDKDGRPMCYDYTPVKFMIKCFEANYPESLGAVLVHKSPWIFQGIWKIIRGWLDPVVASKVHFTNNVEELERFIPRNHIIKELGGEDPWTYQYVEPVVDEDKRMLDNDTRQKLLQERAEVVKDYESATQEWIRNSRFDRGLQKTRNDLAERLRTGYWQLDPYVRARTLYDRTGMIREEGEIQYYKTSTSSAPPAHNGPIPAGHGPDDLD
ncbi:CRAL/TRIO, N-terminal domain [Lasallia pustulata]|uniref:CRAL/TRIO, N-terminal domain n=1 Tax=Lasallia pustulata TaxID=136370 RepID=A0A1W5D271_9LECA|nr:CRAL/TRIO, N-terminal domain [Lasallia pustulata]